MSITPINIGTAPNDGTGDNLRAAFAKVNANTQEQQAGLALKANQTALDTKANLASPSFTGIVVAESSPASTGISALSGSNSGFESRARGSGGTAGAATIAFNRPSAHAVHFGIDTDNKLKVGGWSLGANAYAIYHEGNDGTGSGLDADLLDGQHGSFYQNASNLTTGTVPEPRLPALPISKITDLQTALNGKQASLGFTPVQQGGATGQGSSKVFIGWATDGSGLLCQVDATNFGKTWPINVAGTAAMVINQNASPAVRQVADIGAAFVNWDTAAPAVQLDTPNSSAAYMVWRATRWGARHVAAMHVYEGNMTVTMSVGNLNNFIWDGSGNFTATGNVVAASDIRLKTDLTKIEGALGKVCAINGYTYTRKDTGARQTGVVAQEVQKVLPEAVMENGENLAVAYGNMVGLLIEAIKELKAEVDQLKGK